MRSKYIILYYSKNKYVIVEELINIFLFYYVTHPVPLELSRILNFRHGAQCYVSDSIRSLTPNMLLSVATKCKK